MIPEVVFEDSAVLVCVKPYGVLSQSDGREDAGTLLNHTHSRSFLHPVHRLDREAGGLLVFAKNPQAAAGMTSSLSSGMWEKRYLAVLRGIPKNPAAELTDLLYHDVRKNRTFVVSRIRKGVKEARLSYETMETRENLTLVCVELFTGRTHQIRAQFSSRGLPLAGDGRYGGGGGSLGLWCSGLAFPHPRTNSPLVFRSTPPAEGPFEVFSDRL